MKVAVLGGGAGGLAMVGDLALAGFDVNLYEFPEFSDGIAPVLKTREVKVEGAKTGVVKVKIATTNLKEAIEGADVINVVTVAQGHERLYRGIAPHLKNGQIILTHTAYYGSLQMRQILKSIGSSVKIKVGETGTLLYGARKLEPDKVRITGVKTQVSFATLPASETRATAEAVRELFPQFAPAAHVLQTSIDNLGVVFHTGIAALNIGRIEETKGQFLFYVQGVTPSVARVVQALDNEKMAVEKAFGGNPMLGFEYLKKAYKTEGKDLYEVFHNVKPFQDPIGGLSPAGLSSGRDNRYVTEEVPYGLVPLAHLADLAKISVPTARALIQIYSLCNEVDYFHEGLTTEKMGLAGKTVKQISEYVM